MLTLLRHYPESDLNNEIIASLEIVNVWRDVDVYAADLLLHRLGVDLAHVAATVELLGGSDVKLPHLEHKHKL